MGEVKQTNFRIDQTTADAFRKFCEQNGMSQAQGFDHIMQIVEMDRAKAVAPGRATEIEGFEKSIKDIMAGTHSITMVRAYAALDPESKRVVSDGLRILRECASAAEARRKASKAAKV